MNSVNIEQQIQQSLAVLQNQGVILHPTDTLWGLGADATSKNAIEKIKIIKKRPLEKPFIVLVNSLDMLLDYVEEIPKKALFYLENSLEPLTIIYPKAKNFPTELLHPDGSIAIRKVQNPFCLGLIKKLQKPLLSTSANFSGAPSPISFQTIDPLLVQQVDYVVDLVDTSTQKASKIIKIDTDGLIHWIRK